MTAAPRTPSTDTVGLGQTKAGTGRPASLDSLIVGRLALDDLRHEVLLTLCLIAAIAAVLAPLLLLLGLKFGVIETLRSRLIEDPVFREIKPARTQTYSDTLLIRLGEDDRVSFLVPTILSGASVVRIAESDAKLFKAVDMVPTAAGDPLLLENNVTIPGPGEVVLSEPLAAALEGLRTEDEAGGAGSLSVIVRATRSFGGRREAMDTSMTVVGVLPAGAETTQRVYVPEGFMYDVGTFREGRPVPARGWPGTVARPGPSFDGVLVIADTPLTEAGLLEMRLRSGFAYAEAFDAKKFASLLPFQPPLGTSAYDFYVLNQPASARQVQRLTEQLRRYDALIVPYVSGLSATIRVDTEDRTAPLMAVSLTGTGADRVGLDVPWGEWTEDARFADLNAVVLPDSFGAQPGGTVMATVPTIDASVTFPLRVVGTRTGAEAMVSLGLAAMLRTGQARPITVSADNSGFELGRLGHQGFRLYARSIEDVPSLVKTLRAEDIDVIAQIDAIERIQRLARGLTRMFWLVAVVGICGGIAALIASLYASVKRKTRDIGTMRLLGLPRSAVFLFPIFQAVTTALIAAILATGVFLGMSAIINKVFADDVQLGESICHLPVLHIAAAFGSTMVIALLSSLLSAWQITWIDPAEALRDE